jgi:hypothetical protein
LISCEANNEQLRNLGSLFSCFEAVLGLKIILVGEVVDVESLANFFGCWVALLSMKYLGLPLGASYKSTRCWL